jgi:hypothetical protein
LELPAPKVLARAFVLPFFAASGIESYRNSGGILRRLAGSPADPLPVPLAVLADEVRAAVSLLPARPGASRPYSDLRIFVADGTAPAVSDYLTRAVRAARPLLPAWRPARSSVDRPPAKTPSERQRDCRTRRRDAALETAEKAVQLWIADAAPGTVISAPLLFEECQEVIDSWLTWFREDGAQEYAEAAADDPTIPAEPVAPGTRTFYAAADRLIGPRVRGTGNIRFYRLSAVAADLADRIAKLADSVVEERNAA